MSEHTQHSEGNHLWMMILGCIVPLLILFFVPQTILPNPWRWIIAISLMIGIHVWMMKKHGGCMGHHAKEKK